MNTVARIILGFIAAACFIFAFAALAGFMEMMTSSTAVVGRGFLEYGWAVAIATTIFVVGLLAGGGALFVWLIVAVAKPAKKKANITYPENSFFSVLDEADKAPPKSTDRSPEEASAANITKPQSATVVKELYDEGDPSTHWRKLIDVQIGVLVEGETTKMEFDTLKVKSKLDERITVYLQLEQSTGTGRGTKEVNIDARDSIDFWFYTEGSYRSSDFMGIGDTVEHYTESNPFQVRDYVMQFEITGLDGQTLYKLEKPKRIKELFATECHQHKIVVNSRNDRKWRLEKQRIQKQTANRDGCNAVASIILIVLMLAAVASALIDWISG